MKLVYISLIEKVYYTKKNLVENLMRTMKSVVAFSRYVTKLAVKAIPSGNLKKRNSHVAKHTGVILISPFYYVIIIFIRP